MSTMMWETVGSALTSAVSMGSNEQVEVLALETSLAIWIAATGEKQVRRGAMGGAAGAVKRGVWALWNAAE